MDRTRRLKKGGEFDTADRRHLRWSVEIQPANVADLFTVNFLCEITEAAGAGDTRKFSETFTVLRPTWSVDPAARGKLSPARAMTLVSAMYNIGAIAGPIIGGYFTAINGQSRNNIARLNSDGTLDTAFNPGTGAYATTDKDYGDFELLLDFKLAAGADSGVYFFSCARRRIAESPPHARGETVHLHLRRRRLPRRAPREATLRRPRRRNPTADAALRAKAGGAGGVEEVAPAPSLHRSVMRRGASRKVHGVHGAVWTSMDGVDAMGQNLQDHE